MGTKFLKKILLSGTVQTFQISLDQRIKLQLKIKGFLEEKFADLFNGTIDVRRILKVPTQFQNAKFYEVDIFWFFCFFARRHLRVMAPISFQVSVSFSDSSRQNGLSDFIISDIEEIMNAQFSEKNPIKIVFPPQKIPQKVWGRKKKIK